MEKETLKETIRDYRKYLIIWSIVLVVAIVGVVLYYALNLKAVNQAWIILHIVSCVLLGLSGFILSDTIISISERRKYIKNQKYKDDEYDW